jgi:hypothetical protein
MQFDIRDTAEEVSKAACEKLGSGAGTFGGMIHGLGGVFSFLSLACG